MYEFTKSENQLIQKIRSAYYMPPVLKRLEQHIETFTDQVIGWRMVFNQMNRLMLESKNDVDLLLEKRKLEKKIRDVSQARKAVVGQIFPKLLMYIFLHNKQMGTIKPNIFITDRVKTSRFAEMTTIYMGGETQKPDMDILIYSEEGIEVQNCMIVSLNTSLRERAGQTYKWKLLLEIAQTEGKLKEKYDIEYPSRFVPFVCFATVNFYDEINSPQHRGMFKFFDQSFIGKSVEPESEFVVPLS